MEEMPKRHPALGCVKRYLPHEVSESQALSDWINESPLNKLPPSKRIIEKQRIDKMQELMVKNDA